MSLKHPNIVKVKEMVVGSSTDKIFMVMELGDADFKTCMDMARQVRALQLFGSRLHYYPLSSIFIN